MIQLLSEQRFCLTGLIFSMITTKPHHSSLYWSTKLSSHTISHW